MQFFPKATSHAYLFFSVAARSGLIKQMPLTYISNKNANNYMAKSSDLTVIKKFQYTYVHTNYHTLVKNVCLMYRIYSTIKKVFF